MNRPQLPAPRCTARGVLSKCITGGSLALIAVLAIPAALLVGLIYLVWTVSDAVTGRLEHRADYL